jgi:hypothetical protein
MCDNNIVASKCGYKHTIHLRVNDVLLLFFVFKKNSNKQKAHARKATNDCVEVI